MQHSARLIYTLGLFALMIAGSWGCQDPVAASQNALTETKEAPEDSLVPATKQRDLPILLEETPVNVSVAPGAAIFIEEADLEAITRDLEGYFSTQNNGDWAGTLGYYPLYRAPMDSAARANTIQAMDDWWDKGLRNQTEAADMLYTSTMYRDGDQDVVLLNMDLIHRVIFIDFQDGNPQGMKGMVESSYGKGNATFLTLPGEPKIEYWEVRGDNSMWAVKSVDSDTWCFLPANFNERGGGNFMTVDAMTALLRHRSDNDPNRLR